MADNDIWTIKSALDWTTGYLERKGDENPRLSAEWLLAEACALRRIDLYVSFERPLSLEEREVLRGYVTRRGRGEPLQYITGETSFRYITVKVRPGVLIPRPETEVLVSEALALLPAQARRVAFDSTIDAWEGDLLRAQAAGRSEEGTDGTPRSSSTAQAVEGARGEAGPTRGEVPDLAAKSPLLVADICTGSGCIACSIASERLDARVIATDIAPEAVSLAAENARATGVADRVRVVQCDLGAGVPRGAWGKLDLVVSNPPYVPSAVLVDVPREVADFEPILALDGGADGLDVLRRLLPWCANALRLGGGFAFELHEGHLDQAAAMARQAGLEEIRIVEDLAGRPRVLTGRRA